MDEQQARTLRAAIDWRKRAETAEARVAELNAALRRVEAISEARHRGDLNGRLEQIGYVARGAVTEKKNDG